MKVWNLHKSKSKVKKYVNNLCLLKLLYKGFKSRWHATHVAEILYHKWICKSSLLTETLVFVLFWTISRAFGTFEGLIVYMQKLSIGTKNDKRYTDQDIEWIIFFF